MQPADQGQEPLFPILQSASAGGERRQERSAFDLSRMDILAERQCHPGFQHGFALAITFQCNIECDHCVTRSSPRVKDEIPLEDILEIVDELASIPKVTRLGLTGGEPFLRFAAMKTIVPYAAERGLEVSAITNAFWAKSVETAREKLLALPGLVRIGLSEDVFHRKFIPRIRVENAARAAKQLGIQTGLRFSFLKDREAALRRVLREYHGVFTEEEIDAQPVVLTGRAMDEVEESELFKFDPRRVTCSAVNRPVVTPGGNVYACCGPSLSVAGPDNPLILGNLKRGATMRGIVEESEKNYLLQAIRALGPFWLARLTGEDRFLHYRYADHCDICRVVLSDQKAVAKLRERLATPRVQRLIAVAKGLHLQEMDLLTQGKQHHEGPSAAPAAG